MAKVEKDSSCHHKVKHHTDELYDLLLSMNIYIYNKIMPIISI